MQGCVCSLPSLLRRALRGPVRARRDVDRRRSARSIAGGGNAGATYTNDFVELFNRGGSAVDLTGWTVQYASASSTSWQATTLAGSIAPGRYYLVQLASTAAVGSPLPAPDATGTTNLASSGGKVALVRDAFRSRCGATAGSCSSARVRRGSRRLRLRNRLRGTRACAGAQQHDCCAPRRAVAAPTRTRTRRTSPRSAPLPRNASSPSGSCSGGSSTPNLSAGAGVDVDVQPVLSISLERSSVSFGKVVSGRRRRRSPRR